MPINPPPPSAYPYWYVASSTATLVTTATTPLSVRFEEGTIFECHALYAWTSLDVVANNQSAMFLCQLTDNGTGQQLSNGYVPRNAMFGSLDHLDGALAVPMQFSGKSTLTFSIQNISGSSFTSIYIAASGLRWNQSAMMVQ
jgi:hypothetical protein